MASGIQLCFFCKYHEGGFRCKIKGMTPYFGPHDVVFCNDYVNKNTGSTSSCFITSAVCKALSKADDCIELTAFRHFRDTFMQESAEMQAEVEEYYNIAPKICNAIDSLGKQVALKEYTRIWEHSIKPAFMALEVGDEQKAYNIYKETVLDLKRRYLEDILQ